MAKGYGAGRPVCPHRVKRKNDLAAALQPTAVLRNAILADVQGVENRRAIRSQTQGEYPFGRVRRGRVTLIRTSKIRLPRGEDHGVESGGGWR
jgi:hypothetical protein